MVERQLENSLEKNNTMKMIL